MATASSGAQAQVALRGAADILTMSPKGDSFFRVSYPRHTNFATAEAEQACNNSPQLGRNNIQTTISRSGDLLSQVYITINLDRLVYNNPGDFNLTTNVYTSWVNGIGFAIINEIVALIGNHDFDTQDGRYMFMRESVAAKSDRKLAEEIGLYDTADECAAASLVPRIMHVPLQFWFNNWSEQALPMIGLYWHETRIDLDMKSPSELTFAGAGGAGAGIVPVSATSNHLRDLYYLCNFQYLDRPERALFANQKLEQVFDQVQFLGEETYLSTDQTKQVNIRFNHAVKEIMWIFQRNTARSANDWFNFGGVEFTPLPPTAPGTNPAGVLVAPPYQEAQIFLNNNNRTAVLPIEFFSNIPAHRSHNRIPHGTFIGSYNFGIDSDNLFHTGSVNFSRMDSAYIRFKLWPTSAPAYSYTPGAFPATALAWSNSGTIAVYARNVNLAKASIGMMGVKFAA